MNTEMGMATPERMANIGIKISAWYCMVAH